MHRDLPAVLVDPTSNVERLAVPMPWPKKTVALRGSEKQPLPMPASSRRHRPTNDSRSRCACALGHRCLTRHRCWSHRPIRRRFLLERRTTPATARIPRTSPVCVVLRAQIISQWCAPVRRGAA